MLFHIVFVLSFVDLLADMNRGRPRLATPERSTVTSIHIWDTPVIVGVSVRVPESQLHSGQYHTGTKESRSRSSPVTGQK